MFLTCLFLALTILNGDAKPKVEFRPAQDEKREGFSEVQVWHSDQKIYLQDKSEWVLDTTDVRSVAVERDERDKPSILVRFSETGERRIAKLSERLIGKRLAVMLDDAVLTAPMIRSKFSNPAKITGDFTEEEAHIIAQVLRGRAKRAKDKSN